ncbi:MAG: hypothetical protein R3D25_14455 [Geminicoccaceae bacterium]
MLVTHLAPVSASISAPPRLAHRRQHRGGPVNISRAACAARGTSRSTPPAATPRPSPRFTIAAILMETRQMRASHEALRQGIWRGDLYRAILTDPSFPSSPWA